MFSPLLKAIFPAVLQPASTPFPLTYPPSLRLLLTTKPHYFTCKSHYQLIFFSVLISCAPGFHRGKNASLPSKYNISFSKLHSLKLLLNILVNEGNVHQEHAEVFFDVASFSALFPQFFHCSGAEYQFREATWLQSKADLDGTTCKSATIKLGAAVKL